MTAPAADTTPHTAFKGGRRDHTPPHIPSSLREDRALPRREPSQRPLCISLARSGSCGHTWLQGDLGKQFPVTYPETWTSPPPNSSDVFHIQTCPRLPTSLGDIRVPSCVPQGFLIQRSFQPHPHHFRVIRRQQGPPDPGSWGEGSQDTRGAWGRQPPTRPPLPPWKPGHTVTRTGEGTGVPIQPPPTVIPEGGPGAGLRPLVLLA